MICIDETEFQVDWTCTCGAHNTDYYSETIWPTCERCNTMFDWIELVSIEQYQRLNALLALIRGELNNALYHV